MAEPVVRDIAVKQDKRRAVIEATEQIYLLFNVIVKLSVESAGIQWVQLQGLKENAEFAKNYINALCSPVYTSKVEFPERFYEEISKYKNNVERDSRAVVLILSRKEAIVQGDEIAVVIASSSIEEKVKELEKGQNGFCDSAKKVEQEKVQLTPVSQIDPSLKEFAMKLGYTEEVIQQVLKKQAGKEVDQNILLRELINVSAPSLLQKAKAPEVVVPSNASSNMPHRSEVVARGPSAAYLPSVVAKSWSQDRVAYGREHLNGTSSPVMAHRNGVVSQGQSQFHPNTVQQTMQQTWMQEQSNVYDQYDRQDEEPFLYNQVVGDSVAVNTSSDLRNVVIDGSNVAMSHGNQQIFSCMGIKICIDYFKQRGHNDITVFVPQWRKETTRPDAPIRNQEILTELEQQGNLTFTPSRRVNGRRIVCYDDRFIVKLADETEGVIVSNDNFRDLFKENPKWQEVIEQRILMYSFVNDRFMVPDDPLGRHGPNLDDFLRKGTASHRRICPYLKRCTYGLRCRFYHPERDPNRKEAEAKKSTDYRTRAQEPQASVRPMGDVRSRTYNNVSPYPQPNPYAYQYAGPRHFHQGQIKEGPSESERHYTNSSPEGLAERDNTFSILQGIFTNADELIHQVMKDNPNANLEQLANIIASKRK